ncbi:hypothetical protein F4781DRAFT_87366 [Annulohypoxylon bovei var. microspora]|nr:hypothetical protein F4781DRAFT_87366 [Annulohypoxylon bovei var. microspora]
MTIILRALSPRTDRLANTPKDLHLFFSCRIHFITPPSSSDTPLSALGLVIVMQDLKHPPSTVETVGWEQERAYSIRIALLAGLPFFTSNTTPFFCIYRGVQL